MVILVGETGSSKIVERLRSSGWGRMYVEKRPKPYEGEPWGFDNAAFLAYKRKEEFPTEKFLSRLEVARAIGTPYLAVVPDIVSGGMKSLDFSLRWLGILPPWPWYLAVQDGMEPAAVRCSMPRFSGVFLGGSDKFKMQAHSWCDLAHECGRPFHYGRAGTLRKLEHAYRIGSDSIDSSFPLWSMDRFKKFAWRSEGLGSQLEMFS